MVSWSRPTQPFNRFTHTPILTPPTCDIHNTSLNPVLHPPTCAIHKTSTAERFTPLIDYPMASHRHQIEGNSKQLTQLIIPTDHAIIHPARKSLKATPTKDVLYNAPKLDSPTHHCRHVPVLGKKFCNGPGKEFVCSPFHFFKCFGTVELIKCIYVIVYIFLILITSFILSLFLQ